MSFIGSKRRKDTSAFDHNNTDQTNLYSTARKETTKSRATTLLENIPRYVSY